MFKWLLMKFNMIWFISWIYLKKTIALFHLKENFFAIAPDYNWKIVNIFKIKVENVAHFNFLQLECICSLL